MARVEASHHSELRADAALTEQYALAYLARTWQTGDPIEDLGEVVRAYMQSYAWGCWAKDDTLNKADANEEEVAASVAQLRGPWDDLAIVVFV